MNFASALLYPIVLLLPAAGAGDGDSGKGEAVAGTLPSGGAEQHYAWPEISGRVFAPDWPVAERMQKSVEPQPAWQVHIEQRVQIRITPRAPTPARPDMFVGVPSGDFSIRFTERKIGKCITISGIAGVEPDRGNRLLLYMRDRRLVAADLERSCRARDFYSGFYVTRTEDGRLCVDRDTLLSRSGMNCKLTRIRQLVQADH